MPRAVYHVNEIEFPVQHFHTLHPVLAPLLLPSCPSLPRRLGLSWAEAVREEAAVAPVRLPGRRAGEAARVTFSRWRFPSSPRHSASRASAGHLPGKGCGFSQAPLARISNSNGTEGPTVQFERGYGSCLESIMNVKSRRQALILILVWRTPEARRSRAPLQRQTAGADGATPSPGSDDDADPEEARLSGNVHRIGALVYMLQ